MKLSQMTTEQLQAKRARIDKVLAKRQADFIELFKSNHDKLVKLHKKAGGKVFKGTFAGLLNHIGDSVYGEYIYFEHEAVSNAAGEGFSPPECSIFGDEALRNDEHPWDWYSHPYDEKYGWGDNPGDVPGDVPVRAVKRVWMLEPNGDRPLNEAEARALLLVSGKEVT